MLTGKKAFEAKSQATLIAAIIGGEPPSIVAGQPVAPLSLDRLVKKCLAKGPEARWQTARDLHDELQWITEARSHSSGTSLRAAERHSRWQWALVAALVLAAFLLGLTWWRARTPVDRPLMRFSTPLLRDANGTLRLDDVEFTGSQPGSWLALSPDASGTRMANPASPYAGSVKPSSRRLRERRMPPRRSSLQTASGSLSLATGNSGKSRFKAAPQLRSAAQEISQPEAGAMTAV
jgi:serine/threonine protein kinase